MSSGPYRQRRDLLASRISDEMILVRGAGPEGSNPNFFYLTGIDEPAGALILSADLRVGVGRASPGSGYVHGRRVQQALLSDSRCKCPNCKGFVRNIQTMI